MFILPVIAYLLFLIIYFDKKKNIIESIVTSWLFVTLCTWIIVEFFSVFKWLNTVTTVISWSAICIIFAIPVVKNKLIRKTINDCKADNNIREFWENHKGNLICLFLFCAVICLFSILRSQNLIDNLYHRLAKIMHWIQNGTVDYFATGTPAELQYTKLTEYMNAQIYLLKGPDRIINLVQAGAYVCSGCCVYGISRKIGASMKFALLSAWIYLLTPMVIIETLTTQTDVVAGSYLLTFVYYLLDYIQVDKLLMNRKWALSAVCLSASVLFGYLAKPTVCFAMVIFFVWMCVVRISKRDKFKILLQHIFIGVIVAILLFLPDAVRSYQYQNTPGLLYSAKENDQENIEVEIEKSIEVASETADAGISAVSEEKTVEDTEDQRVDNTTEADRVMSTAGDPREFIMVAIRNLAANATSRCFPKINNLFLRFVEKCEARLDYSGYRYFRVLVEEGLGETSEPSPAIMFFLVISWVCVVMRISKLHKEQFWYLFFATVALTVQAALMGYTWYRQRYLIGAMAVLCPAFAIVLENICISLRARLNLSVAMVTICSFGTANALSYEIPYIVFGFQGSNIHQYFIHDSNTELYYQLMLDYVNDKGYETVGMYGIVSYEYVLWQGIDNLERMEHVCVNPTYYECAKLEDTEFMPECIVEEIPAEFPIEEYVCCHGQWYVCDWQATDENGRHYAVLIPYE